MLTGHPICHEAPVRMAHQEDFLFIDIDSSLHLTYQVFNIGDVIHSLVGEIAAGIVSVPIVLAGRVLDPIWIEVNIPVVIDSLSQIEKIALIGKSREIISMEHHKHRSRLIGIIPIGKYDFDGPDATDVNFLSE